MHSLAKDKFLEEDQKKDKVSDRMEVLPLEMACSTALRAKAKDSPVLSQDKVVVGQIHRMVCSHKEGQAKALSPLP